MKIVIRGVFQEAEFNSGIDINWKEHEDGKCSENTTVLEQDIYLIRIKNVSILEN